MTNGSRPFEIGINYWPRRKAMYMWRDFDAGEVREELAHIAAMGFETVRLFTLAQDFLPERERVDTVMLGRLVDVARAAQDAGLSIVPTVVVINMSGGRWWPEWMIDPGGAVASLYTDAPVVRAQLLLAAACASALTGAASVRAIDIANEIDDAQRPPSRDAARSWLARMAGAIHTAAPGIAVRIGAHLPSLTTENHMRLDDLGAAVDEDVMHAYPLYSEFARSFLDPELVPFACALTAGLSGRRRATLMQEFGLCTAPRGEEGQTIRDDFLGAPRSQYLASEDEGAAYYESVVARLVQTGAAGAYAWCYADYDASLFSRPPLDRAIRERTFGLVRSDGSEKPAAQVFRKLRARRDSGELVPGIVPEVLDISAEEYYRSPAAHFGRIYANWLAPE